VRGNCFIVQKLFGELEARYAFFIDFSCDLEILILAKSFI